MTIESMNDLACLRAMLREARLDQHSEALLNLARPCISIDGNLRKDAGVKGGRSKFGGIPDVPADFVWPEYLDTPMNFLCQINLGEVAGFQAADCLPKTGLLAFLYDSAQSTWGSDVDDRESWRVFLFETEGLRRASMPLELQEHDISKALLLKFSESLTLPGCGHPILKSLRLTRRELNRYCETLSQLEMSPHHLCGYAEEVQGPMEVDCQSMFKKRIGRRTAQKEAATNPIDEWQLLLQLDSEDKLDWCWGDMGRLYFWIRRKDLAKRDFSKVWMILQCS